MSNEEKHDWDRLPRETSRSYELFCVYRNLGPERSLAKARESAEGIPSVARLKVLSRKWNWVERCQQYDDYLEYQDRLRQEKERRQMHERHARVALLGMNVAVKGLESLLTKVQNGEQAVAPADLTRLVDVSVKVERLARGEPTEIQKSEHAGTLDIEARYRAMTPEERRAEIVRILRDELGKAQEEAEALADEIIGAKK
jgi:hypothetical protein